MSAARPTRRFFQFSITSMLLVTALVAVWLAWELAFIRERQAWIRENAALVESDQLAPPVVAHVPWWRMLLGDEAVPIITESLDWSDTERGNVERLFPESRIMMAPFALYGTAAMVELDRSFDQLRPPTSGIIYKYDPTTGTTTPPLDWPATR